MKSLQRILYVLPYTPSPIRVRPYQIIRSLAKAGHEVTVVTLEDGFATKEAVAELKSICVAVHIVPHPKWSAALNCATALLTPTPLWAAYCRSPRMEALLRTLSDSGKFDVAHVEHLRAAHFAGSLGSLPLVLDAVDCITALRRQILDQEKAALGRLFSYEEWWKLRSYEPKIYRPFKRVAVTSEHDASSLVSLSPKHLPPVEVIPNGVDLAYFCQQVKVPAIAETLVFSGKMSYIANEDAAYFLLKEIIPRLRTRRPQVQVTLAGSSPSDTLKALAEKTGNVKVTGFVDDLRPYLSGAMVAVCPMRIGVGIQNKALEAMAMGRPVVATPLAGRALVGATRTGAVKLAETAEAFAEACADLLADPVATDRAGTAARKYVEENHQWPIAAERFIELYAQARSETR